MAKFSDSLDQRLSEHERKLLAEGRLLPRNRPTAARRATPAEDTLPEILFEFRPQGAYVKVSAIDPQTGTEVSIVGAASAPQKVLEQLAARKLVMVMQRRR